MKNEEAVLMKVDMELFNMLNTREIEGFIEALLHRKEPLTLDSKSFIKTFESDFFSQIKDQAHSNKLKIYRIISNVRTLHPNLFSRKFYQSVTGKRMMHLNKSLDLDSKIKNTRPILANELCSIMSSNPDHPIQKKLHEGYLKDRPELIANACEEDISIKTNYITNDEPKVKNLFNSPQEKSIYLAIKTCFNELNPIPNVAIQQIIPYDLMKSQLSNEKFDFFLKSSIDCVVYEEDMPKHYFEIDSSFHDSEDSKRRDKWKDEICKIAGIKLIRIKPEHPNQTSVNDFIRIVQTLMNKHIK
jgi:hypothetical protein